MIVKGESFLANRCDGSVSSESAEKREDNRRSHATETEAKTAED